MKKFISLICVAASILTMAVTAFATEAPVTETVPSEVISSADASVTRAYEYEWRYGAINGQVHKRLWNITLGRWEGEWIPM